MACVLAVHRIGIDCDKCLKAASDSNPVIEVKQTAPHERNLVWICVSCWDKAIAKDRKQAAIPN